MEPRKRKAPRAVVVLLLLGAVAAAGAGLHHRAVRRARRALEREIAATVRAGLAVRAPEAPGSASPDPLDGLQPGERVALYRLFLAGDRIGAAPLDAPVGGLLQRFGAALDRFESAPPVRWIPPAGGATESLLRQRDLAALLAARGLQAGRPERAWQALAASLRARRALADSASGPAVVALDAMLDPPLETIAALLARGVRIDAAEYEALLAELVPVAQTTERCLSEQLGAMAEDIALLLDRREGRLADEHRAEAGTVVGLWLRQSLAGHELVRGIRLSRQALQILTLPDSAQRIAQMEPVERRWVEWLQTVRTRSLYRITPLSLLRRELVRARRLRATRLALALARHAATHDGQWPASLVELAPGLLREVVPLDPLTERPLLYTRSGSSAGIELPASPDAGGTRRVWRVGLPR